jgi:hypothetical protein
MLPQLPNRSDRERGYEMKKQVPARWNFITWLFGGSTGDTGVHG